jgi:UV DNA damage endonuclease
LVLSYHTEKQAAEEASENKREEDAKPSAKKPKTTPTNKTNATRKSLPATKKAKIVPTPSLSNIDDEDEEDLSMPDLSAEEGDNVAAVNMVVGKVALPARESRRASKKSYAEADGGSDED